MLDMKHGETTNEIWKEINYITSSTRQTYCYTTLINQPDGKITSTIDLTNEVPISNLNVNEDLTSDHRPISCELEAELITDKERL